MHILIADSGATKTSWAISMGSTISTVETPGMYPTRKVDFELESIVFDELLPQLHTKEFDEIFFYGAGCKAREQSARIKRILQEAFQKAKIEVKTDIEGAGLSLFGETKGIVVISGTGSSAGLMHEGKVLDIMTSKGYPEGDLGSGCHIGALVLRDYFTDNVPSEIKAVINTNRNRSFDELFLLFQNPETSKQIAAKAMRDIARLYELPYVQEISKHAIKMLLDQLFNHFGEALKELPVKINGKTAFHFKKEFHEVFSQSGITISEIQENPINRLITFHQE